jgi:4a-hydroxytetrahydrobiopterin dehydratase
MDTLHQKTCQPCEGGVDPLARDQFSQYLDQVTQWTVTDNDTKIEREFTFADFNHALAFVNKVAEIAEDEGHHPDIFMHNWNKVRITLWTHAIGGLSINDFVVASKIDRID